MEDWLEVFSTTYFKSGIKHSTPKVAPIFPYNTTDSVLTVQQKLVNFQSIASEVFRTINGMKLKNSNVFSDVIMNIEGSVETELLTDLLHIVEKTCFDENRILYCFHPSIFYFISPSQGVGNINNFADFINDVLFENKKELTPNSTYNESKSNVLHSLVVKALPQLEDVKSRNIKGKYKKLADISDTFTKDCKFILDNPDLASSHFSELLKFYFLIYQLLSLEQLNSFFNILKPEPFFFSLEWESLSKGRLAYQHGWKRIAPMFIKMWSHAQFIEMLNYLPIKNIQKPFSLKDIADWANSANEEELLSVFTSLQSMITLYKEKVNDVPWYEFQAFNDELNSNNLSDRLLNTMRNFWEMIHFQFMKSARNAAAKRYSSRLSKFATDSFCKKRGRLGYTFSLTQEQFLFLSRLCIGNEKRLRLVKLWKEFEKRGVTFDFDSKQQIVILFEKLNLLEKKSDSGDAQYVRTIF